MKTKYKDLVDKISCLPPEQARESIKVYLSLGDIDACELMASYCDGQELLCWAIATKRKAMDLGFDCNFSYPLNERLEVESGSAAQEQVLATSESFYNELVTLNPYPKNKRKVHKDKL